MTAPLIALNSGQQIPQLGLGVFLIPQEQTEEVVLNALEVGYRHIDTAAGYYNEAGVGRALAKSGLDRDEVFITTKLRNGDQVRGLTDQALDASLKELGLDYVDLYLIHWPRPDANVFDEAWARLVAAQQAGKAKAIGVSNFQPHHLNQLLSNSDVVPAVNQVELHPRFTQTELVQLHNELGIHTEAWGPLGQNRYALAEIPVLATLAEQHGATPAQIVLAWHLALGHIAIPKTVNRGRMAENLAAASIQLGAADVAAISELNEDLRQGSHPDTANFD